MTEGIDARLAAAAGALRQHEVTSRRCEDLRSRRDELLRQLAGLRSQAASESGDVDRLESWSLTRVLVSLRGARDETLARERAEAEAARYRVHQAEGLLAALSREGDEAAARLAQLAGAPAAYQAVLDEKERHLREAGDPRSGQLLRLAEEKGRLTADIREIGEALQAADGAARALTQVQDTLRRAAGWSTYDTFFGGGALSSSIKHSRLDEAAQAAALADRHLAALRTELADVPGVAPVAPRLQVDGLTRFADVWFDNIFTDLAVDRRISQARDNVARCQQLVRDVQAQLSQRDAQARDRLAAIARERLGMLTR